MLVFGQYLNEKKEGFKSVNQNFDSHERAEDEI